MNEFSDLSSKVEILTKTDQRYRQEVYLFIGQVLLAANQNSGKDRKPEHLSAKMLLENFRRLALRKFGPWTLDVLAEWGIHCTQDIGNVVFAMAKEGVLLISKEDSLEDFTDVYDFRQAFLEPLGQAETYTQQKPPKIII